jgi:hypothetical protein
MVEDHAGDVSFAPDPNRFRVQPGQRCGGGINTYRDLVAVVLHSHGRDADHGDVVRVSGERQLGEGLDRMLCRW